MFSSSEKYIGQLESKLNQRRQVRVKTCADVYDHWRAYKRFYKKAPKEGIEFQIEYIDTGLALSEEVRAKAPVALALHGAPGSYHDFSLLINHLYKQNVRVIAPNFPEYTATVKTKVLFRHSADEKAAYLRDFLRAIDVRSIDLLVSHSSAIFPTLLILLNASPAALARQAAPQSGQDPAAPVKTSQRPAGGRQLKQQRQDRVLVAFDEPIEVRALVLFNPAGHRLPRSMKPTWFKCGSCHIYQHKLGRSIFRKFGPGFLTVVGVPVRVDNMDNVMLSATVMRNSRCQRVVSQLQQLTQMRIPTLFVFSEKDRVIEPEIFYEMTHFMQLNPDSFEIFDQEGRLERRAPGQPPTEQAPERPTSNDWIRVMVFKAGGHYAYSNYAKIVNQAVSQLMAKARVAN